MTATIAGKLLISSSHEPQVESTEVPLDQPSRHLVSYLVALTSLRR